MLATLVFMMTALPMAGLAAPDTVTVTAEVCNTGTVPPIISDPANGSTFTDSSLPVAGTSTAGDIVTVFRNGVQAGSALADGTGTWSLTITLVPGSNLISAVNCAGQETISVTYVPPAPPPTPPPTATPTPTSPPVVPNPGAPQPTATPSAAPASNAIVPRRSEQSPSAPTSRRSPVPPQPLPAGSFVLTTGQSVIQAKRGENVPLAFRIEGGASPYVVTVEWGDGQSDQATVQSFGDITLNHRFKRTGAFAVKVQVRDAKGRVALLSYIVEVTGDDTTTTLQRSRSLEYLLVLLGLQFLLVLILFVLWEYIHQRHRHDITL